MNEAFISQVVLPAALFTIMLGLGLGLKPLDFAPLWRQPQLLAAGLLGQLLLLPLLTFVLLQMVDLPTGLALGLMIVSLAPGGATSNMISHLCRGDTALSVSLTAMSSLVIPFTLPVLAALALKFWQGEAGALEFPVLATMGKLLAMALVPVLLGMGLRAMLPALAARVQGVVKGLSLLFLLLVVVAITRANWGSLQGYLQAVTPVALAMAVLAMSLGYSLARMAGGSSPQRLTLAVEVGIQNAGIALLVTGTLLQDAQMSAGALLYGILMQLPAFMLIAWRNRPGTAARLQRRSDQSPL